MDNELATILQNIKALIDQATQMGGAGEMGKVEDQPKEEMKPETLEKVMKLLKELEGSPEDEKEDKDESVAKEEDEDDKEKAEKSSEGSNASDKADVRVDDQTDVNDENISEVAKALSRLLGRKNIVKKSAVEIKVERLADENKELRKAVENIFTGLGIADQIKLAEKSEETRKPMNSDNEIKKSLDYIKSQLGIEGREQKTMYGENAHNNVLKSLADEDGALLKGIFTRKR